MIGDCIRSLAFADEVVVIDSNSSDRTKSVAEKLGARVLEHPFKNYADQRIYAKKQAKGIWVLYVDADERVSKKLASEIIAMVNQEPSSMNQVAAYKIPRKNFYLGNHEWPSIEYLERLFLKSSLQKWEGAVHEHALYRGSLGILKNYLIHYTHRDLSTMISKTNTWGDSEARMLYSSHHPKMNAIRFLRIMVTKFFYSYFTQNGWKAGTAGLVESMYQAFSYFTIYAKLWEMQIGLTKNNEK